MVWLDPALVADRINYFFWWLLTCFEQKNRDISFIFVVDPLVELSGLQSQSPCGSRSHGNIFACLDLPTSILGSQGRDRRMTGVYKDGGEFEIVVRFGKDVRFAIASETDLSY